MKGLKGGGGPPLETLTPQQARMVLVKAQGFVEVDLSGIDESERKDYYRRLHH